MSRRNRGPRNVNHLQRSESWFFDYVFPTVMGRRVELDPRSSLDPLWLSKRNEQRQLRRNNWKGWQF